MRWQSLLGAGAQDVRAALFDAVGTLIVPTVPVAEVYLRYGLRHGTRHDLTAVAARLPEAFRVADVAGGASDEQIERERWRTIVRHVFDDLEDTAALLEELWTYFSQPDSWQLAPGANQVLHAFIAAGYQVGVASNFDARLHRVLQGPNQLARSVKRFVSSELGWQKPQPGFFRGIADHLGLEPRQLLLVGDDWINDVAGARAAGWRAIWVSASEPPDRSDVPRVSTLSALFD